MEIRFVSRKEIINKILDDYNNNKQKEIDDELKQMIIDFSKEKE